LKGKLKQNFAELTEDDLLFDGKEKKCGNYNKIR
jgi:hypothetical protein